MYGGGRQVGVERDSEDRSGLAVGRPLELLAPAGDAPALASAWESGADAVYLGLGELNARRGARNFSGESLRTAVEQSHARGVRVYLTLNVDLAESELESAARMLEWARDCGVDAVLVRDPALLALRPEYPQLEFHFSTQAGAMNHADVAAAGDWHVQRVVLAREMSLEEIASASGVGIETEVFVQGALCYCVSGRCLLSSWGGGRSGNRGLCTSPCRVPWTVDTQSAGTPLSMQDLSTAHRLEDFRRAGVRGLKIEGRMKTAEWVGRAVRLYRRALAGESLAASESVAELGAYTGRQLTCGYLDGQHTELTGRAAGRGGGSNAGSADPRPRDTVPSEESVYQLEMLAEGPRLQIRCACREHEVQWSVPKTVVRRAHKAISIRALVAYLEVTPVRGHRLARAVTDDPDFLLMPRAVNQLIRRLSAVVHQAGKRRSARLPIELPAAVRRILEPGEANPANRRSLGDPPDRARLDVRQLESFLHQVRPEAGVIVEGVTAENLREVQKVCRRIPLVVALPAVVSESELAEVEALLEACRRRRAVVEVNSWGGWRLARATGLRLESGPGLPVLNSLAARTLETAGIQGVTLSLEASRRQWEQLTAHCPVSCSLVVFGRPPLITTRVEVPEPYRGRVYRDRRDVQMVPRAERGWWVFRPLQPFDLRASRNPRIRVRHLVVDLIESPDPVREWNRGFRAGERQFRFNYDRGLA